MTSFDQLKFFLNNVVELRSSDVNDEVIIRKETRDTLFDRKLIEVLRTQNKQLITISDFLHELDGRKHSLSEATNLLLSLIFQSKYLSEKTYFVYFRFTFLFHR